MLDTLTNCQGCLGLTFQLCAECEHCQRCCENADLRGRPTCASRISDNFDGPCRPTLILDGPSNRWLHANDDTYTVNHVRRRSIGVEIEVAGFDRPTKAALEHLYNVCAKWGASIGTDGSLSDPTDKSSSVEIRTAPAYGDTFVRQVREIVTAINAANGIVNHSCGLHVHVGFDSGLQQDEIIIILSNSLAKFWPKLECSFYTLADKKRWTNSYCVPYNVVEPINIQEQYFNGARYRPVNFKSLHKYKTIEFRLYHGTLVTREVTAWAIFCAAFVDWCIRVEERCSVSDINHMTKCMAIEPWDYIIKFAHTPYLKAFIDYRLASHNTCLAEIPGV